jgi:hypothetical protein
MRRVVPSGFSLALAVCPVLFCFLAPSLYAQPRQALQTHVPAPAGAKLIGRMPASQQLSLAIGLPLRHPDELHTLLQQLEDPGSPTYHQYLTVAQFTQRFSPTVVEYQQVIGFALSHGLAVTHTSPNRLLLNVTGSVANIEQAFQVTMKLYQHPTENRTFFAPDVDPTVEPGIPMLGLSGLTNFTLPHSLLVHASSVGGGGVHSDQTGSGPGGQFYGSDMRAAYYGTGPLTGTGQALALAELGQWNMADVQAYFSYVNQPLNVPIVLALLGGTAGACPGDCDDGEEAVDIEQIISMAPQASVLIVYEDTSNNADIDIFNQYASDNIAKQMSWSFGIGPGNAAMDETAFAEFHAQGQNFFVASGDAGDFHGEGGWPGFSGDVTDVGGTVLTTDGAGGLWQGEAAWIGSGGGWCDSSIRSNPCFGSPYDGIDETPSYQVSVITTANGGSTLYRNVPDVAAEADTDNFFCSSGTCQGGIGGTSLAAPRWAGFLALVNEQAAANGETVGFLNPLVYGIGQGSSYSAAFHDITTGTSNGFPIVAGYDLNAGWGAPNGPGMINTLAPAGGTNPYFTLSASTPILNLTPGGAPGTALISLTAENGFTGTVDLNTPTIVGAPAGVTASLSAASITGTGTSTLTVSTISSTPGGTFVVAVTGTSTAGIETQPAFVLLALPDFSLSVTPSTIYYPGSSIYLNQGSTTSPTVTVNSQNNFGGTVDLSVSALPSGVTGSFTPATATSTSPSTLTLTASSTAATVGSDYLTISGTSGSLAPPNAPYAILSVSAATGTGGAGTPVSLSSAFNLNGIYTDGTTFPATSGLDGAGSAYSSNLLTGNRILNGVQFNFGPSNQPNAVYGTGSPIPLPSGQFTTLQMLATGIDGPVSSQTLSVTYTDGTTTTFTQSFSDWCGCSTNPGQQSGETFAVAMPYRDLNTGAQDDRPFNLYGYTFVLNSAKTVQSLTLPNNRKVIVLAATLTTESLGTQVSLTSEYNVAGLYSNGITFPATAGMDGGGNGCTLSSGCSDGYSAEQLGLPSTTPPTLVMQGLLFDLGPVNIKDCTAACVVDMMNLSPGVTIALPENQQTDYTTMSMLGTGVQGSHTGTVTVTYTDASTSVFHQTFSDWCNFGSNPNESVAVGGMDRINSDGTLETNATCNLYLYTYALNSAKAVESIGLTNTDGTAFSLVLALTLSGNTSSAPASYSLAVGTASPAAIGPGGSSTATVTVIPATGYAGSVTLTCAVTSTVTFTATQATCSTSPNPASVSGANPVAATLTFTTQGPSAAMLRHSTFYGLWLPVPGLTLIGLGLGSRGSCRKKLSGLLLLSIVLASLVVLPACGGNGSSGGGGGGGNPGTPAGTYTLTITAKDGNGVTQSSTAPTVSVTVN